MNIFFLFVGPTSYAAVIEAAIDIVEKTHGQFHVLVIVADGQVYIVSVMTCVCVSACDSLLILVGGLIQDL